MREFTRCLAWALALGMAALLFAVFGSAGLEHVEGPGAWLILVAYMPFYVFAHGVGSQPGALMMTVVVLAEFVYILAVVAVVRRLARRRRG